MSGRGNKKQSRINSDKKWNVGIYTRRSFDDLDDNESNTIINQKEMLTEYVNNLPNATIVDYYVDDGYSGTTFDRPSFQEMFSDVVSGRINAIIVKDLSRLGRNYIEIGKYLEQIFPQYDLRVIAINDDIDSFLKPDSINNFIVPIKNLINETYSKDISKKVASSYLAMAKSGKFVSGTPPYGYDLDPEDKHHLVINKDEAEVVKKIFEMSLNEDGRVKICKYLNDEGILCRKELQRRIKNNLTLEPFKIKTKYIWSTSTIGRMLVNETYIGNLVQLKTYKKSYKDHREIPKAQEDWIRCDNTHEAIISKTDFNQVQKLIKKNTKTKKKKEVIYSIYNGKLKCFDCGKAMVKQDDYRGNRNISNYFCVSHLYLSKSCSSHKIKTEVLNNTVLESIQLQVKLVIELDKSIKRLFFRSNKGQLETTYKEKIRIAEIKLENLRNKKRDNYKEWKFGSIDKKEYETIQQDIENKINKLNEDIELYNSTYQNTIKRLRKDEYWISHYRRNRKIKKITKEVLDELVESILVKEDGSLIINFKYQDEYIGLLQYIENEGSVKECLNGELVSI
mgnify:CR=1 FL=1